ncbi:hypothetical protein JX265_012201 [Neoarthrinium moseri]|uniref:gluconokinase n=1 Tax=Neoarthrinium moseri TaxID=1658444 RepID=A0A9P9WAX8_9PEZI|nr:hypothetical protein JX265_012201 [Neoarthrinium moseri]
MAPPSVASPSLDVSSPVRDTKSYLEPTTVAQETYDEDDSTMKTVDDLVRRRARSRPDQVIVAYPRTGIEYVNYTMQQLDVFAFRTAKHYQQHIPTRTSSEEKPMVVAILGPSNFDYLVTMLALTKLGITTLFLSTRISQEAIESLITTTNAQFLLADPRYLKTAQAVHQTLNHVGVLEIAGQLTFNFPIEIHADTKLTRGLDDSVETNNLVYIIHSSGSTGLPKPIYQTQKSAIANYSMSMDMKAFITLPLYHNHGICNMFRAIYSGKPIHLYNADLPLTREHLTGIMRTHKFEIFYGVPYALKLLAETDEGMQLLCELNIVMYGGSACPDDLGNQLVASGVNLVGHYGATEVGQLMTSFRPHGDTAWNYVRESPKLSPYLKWISRGPNLFECCVLPGWPSKVASNQPDGSYTTKDLFEPHPTIPQAWKYIARLDDTIALVNGEKFNPVHVEGTIRSNKNVTEAVVFGIGRPALGALIVPAPSLAGKSDDEILEIIWPVVEAAGRSAEAYARISKNMIKLLPHDCAYPRTDKGSVIRQAFYKKWANEIDETYDRADSSSGDAKRFAVAELRDFLRSSLLQTLARDLTLEDDTDFFSLGLDSLQAIQTRSEILKTVDIGGHSLSQTVVFEYPSIEKLSRYLLSLGSGEDITMSSAVEDEMLELIGQYGNFKALERAPKSSAIVTGTTGSLGAHVIAKLAMDSSITAIYCLVRAGSDNEAMQRVKKSLIQRRLYHSMTLSSRRKLVALAADLSDSKLGLSVDAYETVKQNLRTVIHCAWSVNFNMRLTSFVKSNIAGVNHLISLCKASGATPASFNFCSSVSAVARSTTVPIPESLPDLTWAQGMGYAQSKSVAEHICSQAAEKTGVPCRVLRVGQIVADTVHGVWNATEAIPLMLQTAATMGALPKLTETPSWLPVDTVAQTILDISLSDTGSTFANVTNPKTFDWTNDLLPALKAAGLQFQEVEPKEWVRRLRASNPDPSVNPPIKLVDFFASKYDKDDFTPSKSFITDGAVSLSPALANAPVLGQQLVDNFVRYFSANAWKVKARQSAPPKRVIVIAGPAGCGKSTLSTALSKALAIPFIEGDGLHCKAAVEKMAGCVALTDDDRALWLKRISKRSVEAISDLGFDSVVVSCSALKRAYRDTIRKTIQTEGGDLVSVVFIDLQCTKDTLLQRTLSRQGHYMSASMVDGQVSTYEAIDEVEADVLPVDAEMSPEQVFLEVQWLLD